MMTLDAAIVLGCFAVVLAIVIAVQIGAREELQDLRDRNATITAVINNQQRAIEYLYHQLLTHTHTVFVARQADPNASDDWWKSGQPPPWEGN